MATATEKPKKEKPRGKPFAKDDPRINKQGRPRKYGIKKALEDRKVTITYPDGRVETTDGADFLASEFVKIAMATNDPDVLKKALDMVKQETKEEVLAESPEQQLKERRLEAAAKKIEIENEIKQQRADLRAQKEDADIAIKKYRAEQEELKTKKMIGQFVDTETMRYYFSFFQRGITDSFSAVKKISQDLKRLYNAGQDREAEKKLLAELHVCFSNAIKGLEDEINSSAEN